MDTYGHYTIMKSTFHSPEELLSEDSFLAYLQSGKQPDHDYWVAWQMESPENAALAAEAKKIYVEAVISETICNTKMAEAEAKFIQAIFHPVKKIVPFYKNKKFLSVAAAFILALGTAFILFTAPSKETKIQTAKGELSHKILPDGSEVILNATSKLKFSSNWHSGTTREVWLEGEAFFHVAKTPQKTHFVVHTGNCDIIVTGTKFNVTNIGGVTQVLLDEGSVTLQTKDGKKINMVPGDFAEVKNNAIQKEKAEKEKILAWKDHKLVFDNTPLEEAIKQINAQYDAHIIIADSSISQTTITGILPNDNLEILLNSLEATMNFKIVRNNDQISIIKP
ncbi:MAG: FecR domain-containing protein [Bacteroidetes bacterium]|nr:FecR domain-containing protein [Bacteroidota bacterium]